MERVQFVPDLDRMARVGASLEPHDDVRTIREEVDDLPFAFVPELGTDHDGGGHGTAARTVAPT
jgi:hypothetical protein